MVNHVKKIHLKDLFDLFDQEAPRIDIILCREESLISEVQSLLEDEKSVTMITLEPDDLHDQKSILNGLHDIFFDDELSDNDEPLDIIEAIEVELGELESCLLIVEDFSSCSIETQAALLELVIVSRSFKLLLKVNDNSTLSENEKLWDVLAIRSGFLEKDNNFFIDDLEDEEITFQENPEEDDIDQDYSVKTNRSESLQNSNKKPAWFQMLPKYHIAAGVVLILIVFALWDMDTNKNTEQSISLQLDNNFAENNDENLTGELQINETEINSHNIENPIDEIAENSQTQTAEGLGNETGKNLTNQMDREFSEISPSTENIKNAVDEQSVEPVTVAKNETQKLASTQIIQQPEIKKQEAPVKVAETKVSKPVPLVQVNKKTNWSPYQSDKWIKGINSKYYTLQLMASHDEQGVRNFLKEHGVNSQYSVYTTEKNNKPWHVIIYGVYQTHEFADRARKELPEYLKSYSPWVRSFADVQKTLQ